MLIELSFKELYYHTVCNDRKFFEHDIEKEFQQGYRSGNRTKTETIVSWRLNTFI